MKKKVYRETLKRVKTIEENWPSLDEFVIFSTFGNDKHTMRMEEQSFEDKNLLQVYEELSDLEKADLFDLQKRNEEYGKFG